jgi:hypothetical protein
MQVHATHSLTSTIDYVSDQFSAPANLHAEITSVPTACASGRSGQFGEGVKPSVLPGVRPKFASPPTTVLTELPRLLQHSEVGTLMEQLPYRELFFEIQRNLTEEIFYC